MINFLIVLIAVLEMMELVRMEWRPAGWSVCLPLLISPRTIKSRSSLLAPAHQVVPEKGL